jgi:signal transduction histidine kinase
MLIYIQNDFSLYTVSIVIISIIFSCLTDIFNKEIYKKIILYIYILISIIHTDFIYFIPIVCYETFDLKYIWTNIVSFLPLIFINKDFEITRKILIISFTIVSYLMKYRSLYIENLKKEYTNLRDSSKEFLISLKNKNKDLMEKQDYEIHIATLRERNRISSEIHDNIGHLLSSSILQIGALVTINKDEKINDKLSILKNTLSTAMDSIRNSIHNMHDEYVDLEREIKSLVSEFKFCEISLEYIIENAPDKNIKFCFICIIKEALSNIIKHSNANKVEIKLIEHPAFYQLSIKDNGTNKEIKDSDGIGIKNMFNRVNSLDGIININNDNGYSIFISVPKK